MKTETIDIFLDAISMLSRHHRVKTQKIWFKEIILLFGNVLWPILQWFFILIPWGSNTVFYSFDFGSYHGFNIFSFLMDHQWKAVIKTRCNSCFHSVAVGKMLISLWHFTWKHISTVSNTKLLVKNPNFSMRVLSWKLFKLYEHSSL